MKTIFMFLALTFLFPAVLGRNYIATSTLTAPGPDGMITLPGITRNGGLYTISSFKATFYNALEYCKSTGRNLVAIGDSDEQTRISLVLASNRISDNIWTSGIEIFQNEFIWASTSEPMIYKNIGNSNPCQLNNCLAITSHGEQRFNWLHYDCANVLNFMCESK